jgi:hypothetical protein
VFRHARACPGHPRLWNTNIKTWMAGINPAMRTGDCVAITSVARISLRFIRATNVCGSHLRFGRPGEGRNPSPPDGPSLENVLLAHRVNCDDREYGSRPSPGRHRNLTHLIPAQFSDEADCSVRKSLSLSSAADKASVRSLRGVPVLITDSRHTWMNHYRKQGRRGRSENHPERSRRDKPPHRVV